MAAARHHRGLQIVLARSSSCPHSYRLSSRRPLSCTGVPPPPSPPSPFSNPPPSMGSPPRRPRHTPPPRRRRASLPAVVPDMQVAFAAAFQASLNAVLASAINRHAARTTSMTAVISAAGAVPDAPSVTPDAPDAPTHRNDPVRELLFGPVSWKQNDNSECRTRHEVAPNMRRFFTCGGRTTGTSSINLSCTIIIYSWRHTYVPISMIRLIFREAAVSSRTRGDLNLPLINRGKYRVGGCIYNTRTRWADQLDSDLIVERSYIMAFKTQHW
ncbi:hypothetical protein B0H19DRAFT_1311074 [Mycena capillaripes]|nr:hypothetical protein B0H19DRAFT_1311074 [Mycena capillaripes]